jgi:integrase
MPRKYQNGKLFSRKDVARPYYYVQVTVPVIGADGKRKKTRKKVRIGFCDEITKKQAMEARAKVLEKVNAPRMLAQSDLRFADVAQRFIDVRVPQLGAAVQQRYPSQIENHLLPAFRDLKLREIGRPEIEEWLNDKRKAGLAPWTLTGLKGVMSAIFTTAKAWRVYEGENPCGGIRVKKGLVREKRKLTGEQLLEIMTALAERERFIVQILFGLGLRISECLGLKWCDFDLEAGTVSIKRRWYRGDNQRRRREQERGEYAQATVGAIPHRRVHAALSRGAQER